MLTCKQGQLRPNGFKHCLQSILFVSTCFTNPDGPILQQEAAPRGPAGLSYMFQKQGQILNMSFSFCHCSTCLGILFRHYGMHCDV